MKLVYGSASCPGGSRPDKRYKHINPQLPWVSYICIICIQLIPLLHLRGWQQAKIVYESSKIEMLGPYFVKSPTLSKFYPYI